MKNNFFTLLLATMFSFAISGCGNDNSAEDVGKEIDDAMQEAGDQLKEASE